jgi:hypothetical protein
VVELVEMEDLEVKEDQEINQANQEIQEHMDTEVQEDQIHMVCQVGKDLVAVEVLEEQAVQVQNIDPMMNMAEMVALEDQVL